MKSRILLALILVSTILSITSCGDKTTEPGNRIVAKPLFTPPYGVSYMPPISVTISSATEGAVIRYTKDGSDPDHNSLLFTEPIVITTPTTLKAIASKEGWQSSEIATEIYIFSGKPPVEGDGSADNPYKIATLENLLWLSVHQDRWDQNYLQTADIDASLTREWFNGEGWITIGYWVSPSNNKPFTGSYDGQGNIIDNIYLNRSFINNMSFFGYISGAKIENLGVTNVYITGRVSVSGLIGRQEDSVVRNCYSTGVVNGEGEVGGLVGTLLENSTVSKCFSAGEVNGSGYIAGGLIGRQYSSAIINSYSTADVSGGSSVGGLVGNQQISTISDCYSTGSVTGEYSTGGLVGYETGSLSSNSYWNIETSGQLTSAGGEGRSLEEMTFPYAANTYIDWNFSGIWNADTEHTINDGYPYLQNQPYLTNRLSLL